MSLVIELQIASLNDYSLWESIHGESGIPAHGRRYALALSRSGIYPQLCRVRTPEGSIIIPFFERQWKGTVDICTWLSVSGAWLRGDPSMALSAWVRYAKDKEWVAGYLQIEPESVLPSIPEARVGNEVFLHSLDVANPLIHASQIIRRKVRRAESLGAVLVDDRSVLADALVNLYPAAMARLGANDAYALSSDTLRELAASPENLILGALLGPCVEAVMVFPYSGLRAEFFLGASSIDGRDLTAWLLFQAFLRMRSAGISLLNLGGGVTPGDGLYEFKKRFGGKAFRLGKFLQIYNLDTYIGCCKDANVDPENNYFPAYRAN